PAGCMTLASCVMSPPLCPLASATILVGVDALRPKPEIDALPKQLGVHGEHLSRLGPGYDQLTPGHRAALVLGYRGPLPPGVQARHVVEEVTEYRWSCLHRLAHRVVIIDDEKSVVPLASGPPLNTHCHSYSLGVCAPPHRTAGA